MQEQHKTYHITGDITHINIYNITENLTQMTKNKRTWTTKYKFQHNKQDIKCHEYTTTPPTAYEFNTT